MTTPSTTTTARRVGVLFLAAFLLYGIGSSLATTADASGPLLTTGVVLMLLNSAAVIAIGALMLPILRAASPRVAVGYLATRIAEGGLLAAGAVSLLAASDAAEHRNFLAYNGAMVALGLGSIVFCVAMLRSGLVPRFLAVWGVVGYAFFATGSVLELLGVSGAGVVSAIPGGLFEVFFGVWLIVKGFGARGDQRLGGVVRATS